MPRNIDPGTLAAMTQKIVRPVFLVEMDQQTFPLYAWSGIGNLVYNGNTYAGVGELGGIQFPSEGSDIQANGAGVSLSGIQPKDVMDALNTLQIGGQATIMMGFLNDQWQLAGAPIVVFRGLIDPPQLSTGAKIDANGNSPAKVSVPLESRLATLGSGQQRKLTRTDQALTHPDDSGLNWQEGQNDLALIWGS